MIDDRDQRVDLSPLDPTSDPTRFDAIVRSVMTAAAPALADRRAPGLLIQLGAWRRPLLAAAAITALLAWAAWPRLEQDTTHDALASAIGVSTTMSQWMWADDLPSAAQVFYTQETRQ